MRRASLWPSDISWPDSTIFFMLRVKITCISVLFHINSFSFKIAYSHKDQND